jgi:hypothetical protein
MRHLTPLGSGEGSGGAAGARAPLPLPPPWSPLSPPRLEVEEEEENGGLEEEEGRSSPPRCGAGFVTASRYNCTRAFLSKSKCFQEWGHRRKGMMPLEVDLTWHRKVLPSEDAVLLHLAIDLTARLPLPARSWFALPVICRCPLPGH